MRRSSARSRVLAVTLVGLLVLAFIALAGPQPGAAAQSPVPYAVPPNAGRTATVLLLDVSGSMSSSWQGGIKIESAKSAATSVVDMIDQESQAGGVRHQVAVASFSTDAYLDLALSGNYDQVRQTIQSLTPRDSTNMGAGIQQANSALSGAALGQKIIILLSDGQSNWGMSGSEILSGPVAEAARSGTCIYTVGFGDAGDLNEDLLREIAQAACGEYSYAETPYDLEKVYVEVRHRSSGTIVAEYSGTVAQGETTPGQAVVVPANQGELRASLNWPGSRLDMVLTDPNGRQVDESYPDATIEVYARMVYYIIHSPLAGTWTSAVRGLEVPEGIIEYSAVFSVLAAAVATLPSRTGTPGLWAPLAVLLLALGAAALILVAQRSASLRAPSAGVQVAGPTGRWAGFRHGVLRIGRDPRNDLVLSDPRVSRFHARLVQTRRGGQIQDLHSTNGTYVNDLPISSQFLSNNDRIQVGDTALIFWDRRGHSA